MDKRDTTQNINEHNMLKIEKLICTSNLVMAYHQRKKQDAAARMWMLYVDTEYTYEYCM